MKHRKKGRQLGRQRNQKRALIKTMAANLIIKEKIRTTEAKAKELRPYFEKMITKGKKNNLANNRFLARYLPEPARKKIFNQLGPRYQARPGGYTRIVKINPRISDGAKMVIIELVD